MRDPNFDVWLALDGGLHDVALRSKVLQLIAMVRSDWHDAPDFDVVDPAFARFISRHRVATLLPLSCIAEDHRLEFQDRLIAIQATQMRIQATAIDVLERLDDAGIDSRVMKGLASAELDYPRQELRHTGDVDIAVRPPDLDRVVDVLVAAGYRRHPRRSKNTYVVKGATLDGPRNVEVDVHDRLFIRSRYTETLLDDPGVQLSSVPGRAFAAEMRLVNAAGAFALTVNEHKRLSGLIDVMRILDGGVNIERALELADALRVGPHVGGVLAMQAVISGRPVDDAWPRPDWIDRQIRFGPERKLILEKLARFRNMPVRDVPGYLPEWLVPDEHERHVFRRKLRRRRSRQ